MAKKRIRKKKISKGLRPSISAAIVNLAATSVRYVDKELNKIAAWRKGLNPWITMPNPSNKKEQWVKVRANEVYGNPKNSGFNIYTMKKGK